MKRLMKHLVIVDGKVQNVGLTPRMAAYLSEHGQNCLVICASDVKRRR
jgi:hypothetical protein